jgi:hypothetical protein
MRLAEDALEVLYEWLSSFLSGLERADSVIAEYRQMLREQS